jgi:hypothetical protein
MMKRKIWTEHFQSKDLLKLVYIVDRFSGVVTKNVLPDDEDGCNKMLTAKT